MRYVFMTICRNPVLITPVMEWRPAHKQQPSRRRLPLFVGTRPLLERIKMVNCSHDIPVNPTTVYREPTSVKQRQLNLMALMDSIHLDDRAWSCRKVCDRLQDLGFPIGRRDCTTLFRKLAIHCIYRKPRTTIRHIGYKVTPYLLRHLEITKANQVWAMDMMTIYSGKGRCGPDVCHGHLQQKESVN